jgi:hypothetical protein
MALRGGRRSYREEPLGVLAALAGVGLRAEPVHGDGEGLVGLGGDRAVGHRPVENRFTISLTGSTSSIGTGGRTPSLNRNSPRSVARRSDWSSTSRVYSLKIS